jgi:L-lactate dehydrogenase complex protein LldG
MKEDLPSAVGLHSGPSKSADIGHIMVKGVHGPGRLIAAVISDSGSADGP